ERRALEREPRHVALHEAHVLEGVQPARLLEQLRDEIDADGLANERRECQGERSGSRAGVERALVARQRDEVAHAGREVVGPLLLELRELLGGRREAGARRVVRAHDSTTTRRARTGLLSIPQTSS